jgi:nicotinamide riboside kinase
MAWQRHAKIAFIGSHGVRKSTAVMSFAATMSRAGQSFEMLSEVVRYSPLGINEGATPEAQLWVMVTQVQRELELSQKADALICDRSVLDNFAYMLRASGGADLFNLEGMVRSWTASYDLIVRLLPDVSLVADGVRSIDTTFRDEIEAILDELVPHYTNARDLIELPASLITRSFDWYPIAEALAARVGQRLANPSSLPTAGLSVDMVIGRVDRQPFVCPDHRDAGALIPSPSGWLCPVDGCPYRRSWASAGAR